MPSLNVTVLSVKIKTLWFFLFFSIVGVTAAFSKEFKNKTGSHKQLQSITFDAKEDSLFTNTNTVAVFDSLPWPNAITVRLDSLLKNDLFRTTQLGLCVYDLTTDSMIYAHNHQHRLRPASTEKLITAISALSFLGGSHAFSTQLYITGQVMDSVLYGDVYAVGGFDPRFDGDDMLAFVETLKYKGIDSIAGNLYADISMKDTLKWGSGWCWDDESPILTPLLYNGKDEFMTVMIDLLREHGIHSSTNRWKYGICPSEAVLLIRRTHSFDQILMRMMKDSDNLYAEAIFYQLGAKSGKRYASLKDVVYYIDRLIQKLGLDPEQFLIADGSGLSLYNYLTPELEIAFLRYAYQEKNIFIHLQPSLPVAGKDGTLSKRMRSGNAYLNVHAKTGSLEGVSTLAGYATASNGHFLAFCIMNQGIGQSKKARDFQDRVCQILCR